METDCIDINNINTVNIYDNFHVEVNHDDGPFVPIITKTLSSVDLKLPEHQVTSVNLKLPETYMEDINDTDETSNHEPNIESDSPVIIEEQEIDQPIAIEKNQTDLISVKKEFEENLTDTNYSDMAQDIKDEEVIETPEINIPEDLEEKINDLKEFTSETEPVEFFTSRTYDLPSQKTLLSIKHEEIHEEEHASENSPIVVDSDADKNMAFNGYYDASVYPNLTENVKKQPETKEASKILKPAAGSQQSNPISSQVYFDASLYPNINPIYEQLNSKVAYFDSSLYPTKNIETCNVLFAANRSSDTRLYLDSSLFPISTNETRSEKKIQPKAKAQYFDASLYPIERTKTFFHDPRQIKAQDEYFDSSLYPNNDSEEPLISNQYNSITNSKEPIKSKEMRATSGTKEISKASISVNSRYPYTKSPEPPDTYQTSPDLNEASNLNASTKIENNTIDDNPHPELTDDMYNNGNGINYKNQLNNQNNQNSSNGNGTYPPYQGSNTNPPNNSFNQQYPPGNFNINNQIYYENEVLNEIRKSNSSLHLNNRTPSNLQRTGFYNKQQKIPQSLPPIINDSSNGHAFNGSSQHFYNPNNNNYANSYQGQIPYNQIVDPRTLSNPYSSAGRVPPFETPPSRRILLHQLSANTQQIASQQNQLYQPPISQQQIYQPQQIYQQHQPNAVYQGLQYQSQTSRRPSGFTYPGATNGIELTPINYQNNGYSGTVFNERLSREKIDRIKEETLASDDVDDLIDQMAKRRIAIKKLEIEMSRQATRTSALLNRQTAINSQNNLPFEYQNQNSFSLYNQVNTSINYDPLTSIYRTGPPPPVQFNSQLSQSSSNYNSVSSRKFSQNAETEQIYQLNGGELSQARSQIHSPSKVNSNHTQLPSARQPKPIYNNQMPVNLEKTDLANIDMKKLLDFSPRNLKGLDLKDRVSSRLNSTLNKSQILNAETGSISVQSVSINGDKTPLTAKPELIENLLTENIEVKDGVKTPVKTKADSPLPPITKFVDEKNVELSNELTVEKRQESPAIEREPSNENIKLEKTEKESVEVVEEKVKTEETINEEDGTMEEEILKKENEKVVEEINKKEDKKDEKPDVVLEFASELESENKKENSDEYNIQITERNLIPFSERYPNLKQRGKYFWAVGSIARFIARLKKKASKHIDESDDITGAAEAFRSRLLEIQTAIHRVYLEPDGPIYGSLITFLKNPNDMSILFEKEHELFNPCVEIICNSVVDIIQKITEFMPKDGIIGTNSKSALLSLITEGNRFPESSLFDTERERLEFDEHMRVKNMTQEQAMFILMSSFITKGLLTTLLLKPVKFSLLNAGDVVVQVNCKILATIILYIVRMVNDMSSGILDFPWELKPFLYSDEQMELIYKNENIDSMLNRSKMLFKVWLNEYATRLDEAGDISR